MDHLIKIRAVSITDLKDILKCRNEKQQYIFRER